MLEGIARNGDNVDIRSIQVSFILGIARLRKPSPIL
jgi:hypothetical protein